LLYSAHVQERQTVCSKNIHKIEAICSSRKRFGGKTTNMRSSLHSPFKQGWPF